MVLNNAEMLEIKGGSTTTLYLKLGIIGGALAFLAGLLDGVLHPKEC